MITKDKIKCGCTHTDPDYWCVCWFEGYEMGEAEKDEPNIIGGDDGNIYKLDLSSKSSETTNL